MTNQQSIDKLLSLLLWLDKDSELYQAIVMAISALQEQEVKVQLPEEGTTPKVKKTCITCKHYPPEGKWPCIDCDMRNPADRWEPQELSKNSAELEKKNGDLQPTCNELAKDICVPCKDTISRKAAIDAVEILLEQTEEDADVKTWNNAIRGAINSIKHHVPSAQPEPIRINLNEPIKVKLTDWGKEIYYHQYDRTNQIAGREICKPRFPREDENGYTEFQLWCFIELYGMHMGMTLPNVIEPLEIVYER